MKKKLVFAFLLGTLFGMVVMYLSIPESHRKVSKKSNKEEENDIFLDDEFFDEEIAKEFDDDDEDKKTDSPHVTMGEVLYNFLMEKE